MYQINESRVLAVIPARLGSTRLPEKLLKEINGKSILQRVYLQCCKAKSIHKIIIATDHSVIFEHATSFGAEAVISKKQHSSGTDRVAELAESFPDFSYVINVQGDEPFIDPLSIDLLVNILVGNNCDIATLAVKMNQHSGIGDPNIVKLVTDKEHRAMYFSRASIPFNNDIGFPNNFIWNKHVGIYGFKKEILFRLTRLPQSSLEKIEKLEQLRWLENGYNIQIGFINDHPKGIDTIEDLENAIIYARENNL